MDIILQASEIPDDLMDFFEPVNFSAKTDTWSLSPSPFPGAHFATYPIELPLTCIKAGTSEHGVCAACGAPWERVVAREAMQHNAREGIAQRLRNQGASNGGTNKVTLGVTQHVKKETTGWQPTCACNAAIVPATVLDPFNGSGTTGRAALQLNRSYIGIDISRDYLDNLCADDNRAAAGLPRLLKGGDVDLSSMPLWAEVAT